MYKLMKYGMYRVDKIYIEQMRERVQWIMDPTLTDLYVGPVLTVDEKWGFYVPVTRRPKEGGKFFVGDNGAIMGFVHVKEMIPCRREVLKRDKAKTPESRFCLEEDNRRIIMGAAQLLYEADKERSEKE